MKRNFLKLFLATALIAFAFTSCQRDNGDDDTSAATDNFLAENESDRVYDAVNSYAYESGVLKVEDANYALLPSCAEVYLDTLSDSISPEKSITIVFDTTITAGCLCSSWDNKYRRGIIKATWTGGYRDPGTVITITTHNYYVNDNKFDYTKTITNNGTNGAGHLTYDIDVSVANIDFTDGTSMTWTSHRVREWVEGQGTLTPLDDVYQISGTAEGTNRHGVHFTANITDPLVFAVGCQWIKQGTIEITPDGALATRILDFGNGACDSQATVEINGVVYNINLQ